MYNQILSKCPLLSWACACRGSIGGHLSPTLSASPVHPLGTDLTCSEFVVISQPGREHHGDRDSLSSGQHRPSNEESWGQTQSKHVADVVTVAPSGSGGSATCGCLLSTDDLQCGAIGSVVEEGSITVLRESRHQVGPLRFHPADSEQREGPEHGLSRPETAGRGDCMGQARGPGAGLGPQNGTCLGSSWPRCHKHLPPWKRPVSQGRQPVLSSARASWAVTWFGDSTTCPPPPLAVAQEAGGGPRQGQRGMGRPRAPSPRPGRSCCWCCCSPFRPAASGYSPGLLPSLLPRCPPSLPLSDFKHV